MMTAAQIERVRASFKGLAPRGEELAAQFTARLFRADAGLRAKLPRDPVQYAQDLLATLGLVVKNLHRLEAVEHVLMDFGARAQRAGAEPRHFGVARQALVETMRDLTGPEWDGELESAWTETLNVAVSVVIRGAGRARARAA